MLIILLRTDRRLPDLDILHQLQHCLVATQLRRFDWAKGTHLKARYERLLARCNDFLQAASDVVGQQGISDPDFDGDDDTASDASGHSDVGLSDFSDLDDDEDGERPDNADLSSSGDAELEAPFAMAVVFKWETLRPEVRPHFFAAIKLCIDVFFSCV
jgi:hypothetical protein